MINKLIIKKKIPIIISDVDGVIMKRNIFLQNEKNALLNLRLPLNTLSPSQYDDQVQKLPFVFFTNN
jgi:hypothetical protein